MMNAPSKIDCAIISKPGVHREAEDENSNSKEKQQCHQ
jgi:hypothetical protein